MEHHLHTLMPCCKDATLLVEQQLHQPLSRWQRIGLKFHLLYCHYCRRYAKQSRAIDKHLRQMAAENAALDEAVKRQWEVLIAAELEK